MTTTATYSINLTDTDTTPAWMALCLTATPGAQDSGRVRYTVTVAADKESQLVDALVADDSVLKYEQLPGHDAEVARLIARSISHTEIVRAEWSAALADALKAESDDSVEADDETIEFWGTTDDGGEWRVHLTGKRTE